MKTDKRRRWLIFKNVMPVIWICDRLRQRDVGGAHALGRAAVARGADHGRAAVDAFEPSLRFAAALADESQHDHIARAPAAIV